MTQLGRWCRISLLCTLRLLLILAGPIALAGAGSPRSGTTPNPLPTGYWSLPLLPQGQPPSGWSQIETSLAPSDCGACHVSQYRGWQSSRHAHAFSPGLVGQLLTMPPDDIRVCMSCHAPLAEQQQTFLSELRGQPAVADISPAFGNGCPSCHVRQWHHYGPPIAGQAGGSLPGAVHGGAQLSTDFERSAFCSGCHQFPASAAVNGKPLENTYVEWRKSRFAAEGRSCQACHMPDRQHLWRGIHDPAMVEGGLTAVIVPGRDAVRFTVTSRNIGHDFPTYTTPRVILWAVPLDNHGGLIFAHAVHHVIERDVEATASGWLEQSDTRLRPGQSASVIMPWAGYDKARVWLQVQPDFVYHREVYPQILAQPRISGAVRRLITLADQATLASAYRLFESTVSKPSETNTGHGR